MTDTPTFLTTPHGLMSVRTYSRVSTLGFLSRNSVDPGGKAMALQQLRHLRAATISVPVKRLIDEEVDHTMDAFTIPTPADASRSR